MDVDRMEETTKAEEMKSLSPSTPTPPWCATREPPRGLPKITKQGDDAGPREEPARPREEPPGPRQEHLRPTGRPRP